MNLFDTKVQLGPVCEEDMFAFLRRVTQEWQFLIYADALGIEAWFDKTLLSGAELALDSAVEQWNHWANQRIHRNWFLVLQRFVLEKPHLNHDGVFFNAGENLLVVYRCESVVAMVSKCTEFIAGPGGVGAAVEYELPELHCILAPPHDDTLKVLPISLVPNVQVLDD